MEDKETPGGAWVGMPAGTALHDRASCRHCLARSGSAGGFCTIDLSPLHLKSCIACPKTNTARTTCWYTVTLVFLFLRAFWARGGMG
jgi:hypothetical protein